MNYLKLKIVKLNCFLVIEVIHMDERFRKQERGVVRFEASNKFVIESDVEVAINAWSEEFPYGTGKLFVWGINKGRDNHPAYYAFKSNSDRDEYLDRLFLALKEFPSWFGDKKIMGFGDVMIVGC